MINTYAGMGIVVIGAAVGQLLMKSGLQGLPFGDYGAMLNSLLYHNESALLIIAGIFSSLISMIVCFNTLNTNDITKTYPILSLGYIIVYLAAAYWPGLAEPLSLQKSFGIALIILGVWITQSRPNSEDA